MRFELLRFRRTGKPFDYQGLDGLIKTHQNVEFALSQVRDESVHSLVENYQFKDQKQVSGILTIGRTPGVRKLEDRVEFIIRVDSGLLLLETGDNPLLLEWSLDFFSIILGIELEYAPVDRQRVKKLVESLDSFEVKVDTPRGPRDVKNLTSFPGEPLLCYDLTSAALQLDFNGKFELDITLETILVDSHASEIQKEYALQVVEQYLF